MERSHIPLNKWLLAFYLLNASKKGMSAHQLHRALKLDYKSAWSMCHRIREAMREGGLGPLGGEGKIVEADETYFGSQENPQPSHKRKGRPFTQGGKSGPSGERAVVALVERGGHVRSFHPAIADGPSVGKEFAAHETVVHSRGEYVRDEVHTNSVEGYFSIFKRGMRGIYQHCKEKHLHRYLSEYEFRYNHRVALGYSDIDRTLAAIRGVEGKRLMYRQPH